MVRDQTLLSLKRGIMLHNTYQIPRKKPGFEPRTDQLSYRGSPAVHEVMSAAKKTLS